MNQKIVARPDKNEFLLYAMLDTYGLMRGNPDSHFLRRKAKDHFSGYKGIGLTQRMYCHHSKPVSYVLLLNEAPDFAERRDIEFDSCSKIDIKKGRAVLPYLIHFYKSTDFEEFYNSILPRYKEECDFVQGILDRSKISYLLDEIWKVVDPFYDIVIPMPLEGAKSGVGPGFCGKAFHIIGPPFDSGILELIVHEGSHPRAKHVLKPIKSDIKEKSHLLEIAMKNPNYSNNYNNWEVCFEEHLIRAMSIYYLHPKLGVNETANQFLKIEEEWSGMVFIRDFYDEIRRHDSAKVSTQEVALDILRALDKKYTFEETSNLRKK